MPVHTLISRLTTCLIAAGLALTALAQPLAAEERPAKELFGSKRLPAKMATASYGSYAKGCIAGAVAIPTDGPAWQAMRLSRNRRWGHPQMIALLEEFSQDAQQLGWPGLLLGDISQPRGGPMLSGHASHQVGLDADIWFTPMPDRRLSAQERDELPFTSMLDKSKFLTVDSRRWTSTHARLVMKAASYPQVERVFVNPAIKKKLCDTWQGDRSLLGKVRPIYGHDEHFHIRIKCPEGVAGCKPQAKVAAGDGCDASLDWWFTKEPWAKPKPKKDAKPVKPWYLKLSDLPKACGTVLAGASPASEQEVTYQGNGGNSTALAFSSGGGSAGRTIESVIAADTALPAIVPIPIPRPLQ
ncbi:penicillin-insensitive murein endopeptidase [Sinorhizobium sp. RAC02]|uniref:penicillin-insensitive murein endopeptidase n=1 Tax=Sinorhizobium sp. RAC02 TaxID=1842534 RepID=UPI00083CE112|nr:penicillin-insensitive murein endopeptidase [Sinorhizobium sp. RAC02]AOF89670.1 penicillin-insensitive murein endopeptidase family protein [Sinorhizobium sp. RAC02]